MINKRIYFFWGNPVMSWMRYMTLYSFRRMNPDWDMTIYLSEHKQNGKTWRMRNLQDFFFYDGANYINRINDLGLRIKTINKYQDMTPSHASNFFKWDLLANGGGIYADMDILWVKPIDDFYNRIKGYDVAICQTNFLSIGLLGSSGNKFFKDIYENTFKNYDKERYQSAGVENIYDLYNCDKENVLDEARKKYPYLWYFNIPMETVYPFNSKQVDEVFSRPVPMPEKSIGYHWYAGHPTTQKFNNLMNEKNYKKYNTLFSKLCSDILS